MKFFKLKSTASKVSVLGLSCDFGSFGISGCKYAPVTIEKMMTLSGESEDVIDIETGKTLFHLKDINSYGILSYKPDQSTSSYLEGAQLVAEHASKRTPLLSIGGDHLISFPVIKGILKNVEALQVIHFDAHFDANSIGKNSIVAHNNFVTYLCKEDKIINWFTQGQRGFSFGHKNLNSKIKPLDLSQIDREIPVYITIDMDVIDCDEFSAVNFPQAGKGHSIKSIFEMIQNIQNLGIQIAGIDVCEYNPKLDSANYLYARKTANLVFKLLSIMVKNQETK